MDLPQVDRESAEGAPEERFLEMLTNKIETPVVQNLKSVIHRINHFPVDEFKGIQLCYPSSR